VVTLDHHTKGPLHSDLTYIYKNMYVYDTCTRLLVYVPVVWGLAFW